MTATPDPWELPTCFECGEDISQQDLGDVHTPHTVGCHKPTSWDTPGRECDCDFETHADCCWECKP